jgi:hypothetical protein
MRSLGLRRTEPLNRQSEQYAREQIELSVSTMGDHVGATTVRPLYELRKAQRAHSWRRHHRAGAGEERTVPGGFGPMSVTTVPSAAIDSAHSAHGNCAIAINELFYGQGQG